MELKRFVKMQGAGNDFVVIDNRDGSFTLDQLIAAAPIWCDRRFGIGADGVLALEPSTVADFKMTYRNADGSDAGMCGNGGRCLSAFAHRSGIPASHTFECKDRLYKALVGADVVKLDFPVRPVLIQTPDGWRIDTGTDHLVVPIDASLLSERDTLRHRGSLLRHRHNANVNFVVDDPDPTLIRIRTFERGVEDLTLACGTGALSAATWWHHRHAPSQTGAFHLPVASEGGTLEAGFRFDSTGYHSYHLTGPAIRVFEGRFPA